MAQTGYTPIYLYYSGTATHIPLAANLGNGELAINAADGNLFYKNTSNAVVTVPVLQSSSTQNGWLSSTDWNTFNSKAPAGSYLTSVTADSPLTGAGTSASHLSIPAATGSVNGYLTSTDWTTFNNKQPAGSYLTTVTADSPLTGSGTSGSHLSMPAATGSVNGYLTSTDWTTFNSKQPAGTYVTSVSGTAPVVSSGGTTPAISMAAATSSVNGYLTSADWTTFNSKQAALVSGTNIKTVNGTTLLGSGDLGTIAIAYGGTNATSFNAPSSSINGLVWFDGTRLVNDATTSDVGYNASTNTFYANNGIFGGTLTVTSGSFNLGAGGANGYINSNTWYGINSGNWIFRAGNASQAFLWNGSAGNTRMTLDINSNLLVGTSSSPAGTGNILIDNGNLIIGTSGKGIDFSATAGTGTSELLADYEEGTWTPADNSGAGLALTINYATYTKVGRTVTINAYISYPATASVANASLSGLPYTVAASDYAPLTITSNSGTALSAFTNASATTISIGIASNYATPVTNITLSSKAILISGTYTV